jgi:hypothetical protein
MPGSLTTPGRSGACDGAPVRIAFHVKHRVGTRDTLSRLNGWPMHSPTDASPTPSRTPAHGSGPMWTATPFIVVDLHHLLLAGLPAHALPFMTPSGPREVRGTTIASSLLMISRVVWPPRARSR